MKIIVAAEPGPFNLGVQYTARDADSALPPVLLAQSLEELEALHKAIGMLLAQESNEPALHGGVLEIVDEAWGVAVLPSEDDERPSPK